MTEQIIEGTLPEDELNDSADGTLCQGGESYYDQQAVATVPFDESQFELPEDFILEDDDDE